MNDIFFPICTEYRKLISISASVSSCGVAESNSMVCTIVNSTVGIKNALGWGARALQINNTFAHARGRA